MEPRGRALIVDGDVETRQLLGDALSRAGYLVETAADGFRALAKMADFAPDAVLTELNLPGLDGLTLLHRARLDDPERVVVVMADRRSAETAVEAMRRGASDCLIKPVCPEALLVMVDRAVERRRLRAEVGHLRARLDQRLGGIIGSDPALSSTFRAIRQIAPSLATVLITGESGTGKGLVAQALHQYSQRASGPFVKLHCAALAETLLESELFGHERGAFTGALARRDGRLQQADGGTLFLDEIGEISPAVQVKLLRFLQEREYERVGGNQTMRVDVRVIAATNRNLADDVTAGRFREDLYYRLNVVAIEMPPLRSRRSDIPVLAAHFLGRFAAANGRAVSGFTDAALRALAQHRWPGNVRELENAIERAVVVTTGELIDTEHLPPSVTVSPLGTAMPPIPGATLAETERFLILKTLEHTGGCKARAAQMLGISYRKIQYKLREYQSTAEPAAPAPMPAVPAVPGGRRLRHGPIARARRARRRGQDLGRR